MITVPIEISARHVHLTREHVMTLFGEGAVLHAYKAISQPGQYAAEQMVDLVGPRGTLTKVRVVGPERPQTQIELALTDARHLGVDAPVRPSGEIAGSGAITLVGPVGRLELQQGAISQQRHIHCDPDTATKYGLQNKQIVRVKTSGYRAVVFENVIVRVHPKFAFRFHLDTDEGNAAGVQMGDVGEILL
jgi:putative phosphotransacetylase